jgi:signal recognition particle receptor subunit alpha
LQPLIAACDTFRAGAVEQLRQHTNKLGVELFEKGYEKDPAEVAISGSRLSRLQLRSLASHARVLFCMSQRFVMRKSMILT